MRPDHPVSFPRPTRHLASLLAAVAIAAPAVAQFAVTGAATTAGATPLRNARSVPAAAALTLTFSAAVDPATINAQNIHVAGRWSGPVPGVLTVGSGGTTVTFAPQRPMFASEIATLTVSHAVLSAGGAPLTGGFYTTWWIACAPSSGVFTLDHVVDYRMPGEGLITTYGFFAGDIDGDGSPDMSATNETSFDVRLLKNDGCGHFGPMAVTSLPSGTEPSPNEGADFDGDGRIDLATGNQNGGSVAIFRNNGAGGYVSPPTVHPIGGSVHGLALLDADSDGDVDVVATNQTDISLLLNNGNGTFQAPMHFDGGGVGEWSIGVGDANNDGKPDIFCGLSFTQAVTVLLGDGAGHFTLHATAPCGGFPWQMATGDLNGDGTIDCVVGDHSNSRAIVLIGTGTGGFQPFTPYSIPPLPVSVDIGDLEGDGDLDIVTSNFNSGNATLLRNNGGGVFVSLTNLPTAIAGSCAVIVDYDRDGDTDVIVVDELSDQGFVYRQQGPNPSGVQPPSCDAALRVNSFANRGGYGTAPAHFLPGGQLAFFEASGGAFQFVALFAGSALAPGLPSPFGLLNLDVGQPFDLLVGTFCDAFGEARIPVLVPTGLPSGSTFTTQCLLTSPAGLVVSNPEQAVF